MQPLNRDLEPAGPRLPRREQGMPWWPIVVAAAVLLAFLGWYLWSRNRAAADAVAEVPEAASEAPEARPEPSPEAAKGWDLPELSESDDFLRDVAARLSSHPQWLTWVATDDLVRRFVAAVDEVARGELPSAQVGFLAPKRGFAPATSGGKPVLDPGSSGRYGRLTSVISGLDAQGAAELYRRLKPLLEEAYRDLGYPNGDFDAALAKAVATVLATPELDQPIELVAGVRSYRFADPELEALPSVQKLLLRFGRENAAEVKRKLRELARELDRSQLSDEGAASPMAENAHPTRRALG